MLPSIQRIKVRHAALAPLIFFPPESLDEIGWLRERD